MKLLSLNKKTGVAHVKIDSPEDLWYLQKVLEPGDIVKGKSSYKQKLSSENERQKSTRKTITAKIKIEKISFDNFNLRLHGKILETTLEQVSSDEFHSIEVSQGSDLWIQKQWKKYQKEILKDAERNTNIPRAIVCSLDDSEANLGKVTSSGIKPVSNIKLELSKKRYSEKKKDPLKNLAKEIIKEISEKKIEIILLASPLFWKDELKKQILEIKPDLNKKVITETTSTGSEKAFRELILKQGFSKIVKESHYIKEEREIENLLSEISKNSGKAEYGFDEVEKVVSSGAVKTLLISEHLIKSQFKKISKIISRAEESGAEVLILNPKKDAGKKLEGLGGIAAILRYKI